MRDVLLMNQKDQLRTYKDDITMIQTAKDAIVLFHFCLCIDLKCAYE